MAENSKIGWTDHTMNFWWGCNKVSEECRFCYIGRSLPRRHIEPFNGPFRNPNWEPPFKWNRSAARKLKRLRIFTCSESDFFHPGADEWRDEAWEVIRDCEYLDWLVLTKRADLIQERLPSDWGDGYPNVWLGVTCGISSSLPRVEELLQIPAEVRLISAEPLLEQIDFRPYLHGGVHWIITGCENAGKDKRRSMDIEWVRDIDRQCRDANVAHFFKQRYVGSQLCYDGVLDGEIRQEWPRSAEMDGFPQLDLVELLRATPDWMRGLLDM